MFIDYFLLVYTKLLPLFLSQRKIVCDRYIYDLAVNLGEILQYTFEQKLKLIVRLERFFPKPDHVILLDVDEKTAFIRKIDTPHINYLIDHRNVYLDIAKKLEFTIIDASKSREIVLNEAKSILAFTK